VDKVRRGTCGAAKNAGFVINGQGFCATGRITDHGLPTASSVPKASLDDFYKFGSKMLF
jgi:hypothetical protein